MHRVSIEKYFKNKVIRRYCTIVAFAVFGLVAGASIVFTMQWYSHENSEQPPPLQNEITQALPVYGELEASEPVRLRIPSIGVDAVFEEPLGVKANYEIEVPESYETVGWYKYGPSPGEIGPAVVLGHVDSFEGPAVLYSLGQVKVGETIEIDREDGSTAVFVVESLEKHEQSGFPTEKVYSDLDYPGLRLITCTGTYDKGIQRYSHNLIVFAKLLETDLEGR